MNDRVASECGRAATTEPGSDAAWLPIDLDRSERRDAAENRRRVLAAARDLFAAEGVDAVSMNQIARAAGIGPGTLYRRYAHKGLLCAALLDENVRRFHADIQARVVLAAEAPALERLEYLLTRQLDFNEENGPLLGAMADAACGERRAGWHGGPLYSWLHRTTLRTLEQAVAAGELPALDTVWLADALLAPLAIDLYLFQRQERGFSQERLRAAIHGLLTRLSAGASS